MSEMTEMLANLLMQHTGKSEGFDITDPRDLTKLQQAELDARQRLKNKTIFNPQGPAPMGDEDAKGYDPAGPPDPRDPQTMGDFWELEGKHRTLRALLEHAKMQALPSPQIPLRGAQDLPPRFRAMLGDPKHWDK